MVLRPLLVVRARVEAPAEGDLPEALRADVPFSAVARPLKSGQQQSSARLRRSGAGKE